MMLFSAHDTILNVTSTSAACMLSDPRKKEITSNDGYISVY